MPRNVWALSWVAFFNDTATEMSYWLLPQFLVGVLGASPMAFGLIEGAAETVSSFGRLLSGWLSDRLRRRKPLVAAGYTVANIVKPWLAVAASWGQVFWVRFADRAAKGFRGAPRDALIADSVSQAQRGAAFGLRQAMDTAGAVLGPLSALALLPLFSGDVRKVFWLATIPGAVCILLVWFGVSEARPAETAKQGASSTDAGRSPIRQLEQESGRHTGCRGLVLARQLVGPIPDTSSAKPGGSCRPGAGLGVAFQSGIYVAELAGGKALGPNPSAYARGSWLFHLRGGLPGILARAGTAVCVVSVRSIWDVLCDDGRRHSRLDCGPGSQLISRVCFRSVQLAGRRGGPSRKPGGGVVVAPLFSPRPLLHFRLTLILCGYTAVAGLKPPAPIEKDHP